MGEKQNDCEKLFLMEVLVDSLLISNSSINLDKDLLENLTDTCVLFQFLHYPPLVVCESDFMGTIGAGREDNSHVTFKSGKSCFFSLRTPKGPILPVPFEVKMSVLRRLKEGVLPDKLEVGKTTIKMNDEFTELLNADKNCESLPLSKSKKGVFEIQDGFGKTVGSVTAFIRVSCFGKLIITQFSMNKEDEQSFLFKGMDVKQVCPKNDQSLPCGDEVIRTSQVSSKKNIKQTPPREVRPSGDQGYGQGREQREFQERRYSRPPTINRREDEYDTRNACPESRPCGCPIDYSYRPPPPPPPPQSYGGRPGRGPLCECPYPVPPSVMNKYNNQQRPGRNLDLTPGEVGMDDDRVVFQLPLKKPGDQLTERDKQVDSSVYYKLSSSEETRDGQQKNTVHIKSDDLPGMAGKGAVGPVSGLPVDDKHDVFLLKIGKKCDGDKKRNLELELRTPKMKEPKPPTTDQDTQYLESDIPKPEGEAKGKKGKKGSKGSVGKGKKGKGKKK